jgi:hypothetical protein
MAGELPEFAKAPSFISDVQMEQGVSPDGQAMTITFGNFGATLAPRFTPPVVVRTFSILLPLKNMAAGARLTGGLQGGGAMEPGTSAMLIFRAGGISTVFDPLFGPDETTGFTKEINLPLAAGADLRMTIILALEGYASDDNAQAQINVTAVDLTIVPADPAINV